MDYFKYIISLFSNDLSAADIGNEDTAQKQEYATTDLLFLISLIGALSSYAFLMFCYLS